MELWYSEMHTENVKFSIRVDEHLHHEVTEFQQIDVFHSQDFANFLTLDGYIMISEKDEFIYHEMITHPAMALRPDAKNILVIGAGDGGTLRELGRYQCIETIDVVEIDPAVVRVCSKFFPSTMIGFQDSRITTHYEDGLRFIRNKVQLYDVIIVDSTSPFGPGEGLFTKEFYGNCYKALKENGILINQHESPYYASYAKNMKRVHRRLYDTFPIARVYQAHLPTYPSGHWLFGFASKTIDPIKHLNSEEWNNLGLYTKYYNADLHTASFALPTYVKELLVEARYE